MNSKSQKARKSITSKSLSKKSISKVERSKASVMAQTLEKELFPKENMAVVLYGPEDIRMEKWALPEKLEPNGKCC